MTTFAELALHARQRHGWTHERLAEALDVSIHTYRSWLKDDATSAREAPWWALAAVEACATGREVRFMSGELEFTVHHRGA